MLDTGFTSLSSSSGVLRYSRTASPRWAGALSQLTRSGPGCFSFSCVRQLRQAVASGRQPRSRCCGCPPVPSIPPRPSPGTPLNSSWLLPIPRAIGVHQRRLTLQHPLAPNSASARKWASSAKNILASVRWASSHRAAYSATKVSRLDSSALSRRFLGALAGKPQPVKPVQATAAAPADAKPF